jgi:predicted flap endonuclease-1-like 5' DNA nuclease
VAAKVDWQKVLQRDLRWSREEIVRLNYEIHKREFNRESHEPPPKSKAAAASHSTNGHDKTSAHTRVTNGKDTFALPDPFSERDDLKKIRGIGPRMEFLLNQHGVTSFRQIACWKTSDVETLLKELPVASGRIRREKWMLEAREEYRKKYGHDIQ